MYVFYYVAKYLLLSNFNSVYNLHDVTRSTMLLFTFLCSIPSKTRYALIIVYRSIFFLLSYDSLLGYTYRRSWYRWNPDKDENKGTL